MAVANTSDFFGGGNGQLVDPFTGLGPDQTLAQQQQTARDASQFASQNAGSQTANANAAFARSNAAPSTGPGSGYLTNPDGSPMTPEQYDAYARAHHLGPYARGFAYNLSKSPATMGVLAAPLAVTGAGFALGGASGLGFGGGEAAAGAGGESIVPMTNEATGLAQAGPGIAGHGIGSAGGVAGDATAFTPAAADAANAGAVTGGVDAGTAMAPGGVAAATPAAAAAPAAAPAATAAGLTPWERAGIQLGTGLLTTAGEVAIAKATTKPTKEENALIATQQQLAQDAARRQAAVEQQQADYGAQKLVSLAPYNQLVSQMVGPQAAFSQQQMQAMTPMPPMPVPDPSIVDYRGADPKILKQVNDYLAQLQAWKDANAARQQMVQGAFSQPLQGPTPIKPTTVLPVKRY